MTATLAPAGAGTITGAALSQLGKDYGWAQPVSWRAVDPPRFDCSGLVGWSIYQATGVTVPHQSATMYGLVLANKLFTKVPYSQAAAGDIVFFGFPLVHHCGVYLGNGQMVEAPDLGIKVRVSSVAANPAKLMPYVGRIGAGGGGPSSGTIDGLDAEQTTDAGIIAQVGAQLGASTRDIAVAIMTALDESGLRNLSGGDRDSAGLFQQRPSQGWGTLAQVTNPVYAANAFFRKLLAIPNRDTQDPWMEAQDVQHSGDPSGSNYQHYWGQAQQITLATGSARLGVGDAGGIQLASASLPSWLGGALGAAGGSVVGSIGQLVMKAVFVIGGIGLVVLGAKNAAEAKPSTNVLVNGGS